MSLAEGVAANLPRINVEMTHLHAQLEAEMEIWSDDTFTAYAPVDKQFVVPEMINVGVQLKASDNLVTVLEKCWATHSEDPDDSVSYVFLDDYCGDEAELNVYESLKVYANGESSSSRFGIESFTFSDDEDGGIFLHCNVRLDDTIFILCTYQT